MTDAAALRATLNLTDMTMEAIQASGRSMMRFYDKPGGATTAVQEWRSVLQTSSPSQSLPLLYAANEVLQTSKRNRGNKFLEAFSPVLGSSLQFICARDRSAVEKVRRTVKVWGDRRVFSMRFVLDVLAGLEQYREGNAAAAPEVTPSVPSPKPSPSATPRRSSATTNSDDDDDDMFGGGSDGEKLLDVSIDATALAAQTKKASQEAGSKRRLGAATQSASKKPKALSGQNFLDMFQSIANLDEKYKSSLGMIESIPPSYLDENSADIDDLVGDELTEMYKKVSQAERNVKRERHAMFSVAVQRRELEKEAKRYVSWLKNLAKVDDDDIEFCGKLEKKLDMISVCHEEAKSLRDKRRSEAAQKQAQAAANAQREAEEKERQRIQYDAKMESEAKPGMMWNRDTREYEYIHDATEESWRDWCNLLGCNQWHLLYLHFMFCIISFLDLARELNSFV